MSEFGNYAEGAQAAADVDTLEERLAALEAQVKRLTGLTDVYGDTLDEVRNRVWSLEHGRTWQRPRGDDD